MPVPFRDGDDTEAKKIPSPQQTVDIVANATCRDRDARGMPVETRG